MAVDFPILEGQYLWYTPILTIGDPTLVSWYRWTPNGHSSKDCCFDVEGLTFVDPPHDYSIPLLNERSSPSPRDTVAR